MIKSAEQQAREMLEDMGVALVEDYDEMPAHYVVPDDMSTVEISSLAHFIDENQKLKAELLTVRGTAATWKQNAERAGMDRNRLILEIETVRGALPDADSLFLIATDVTNGYDTDKVVPVLRAMATAIRALDAREGHELTESERAEWLTKEDCDQLDLALRAYMQEDDEDGICDNIRRIAAKIRGAR